MSSALLKKMVTGNGDIRELAAGARSRFSKKPWIRGPLPVKPRVKPFCYLGREKLQQDQWKSFWVRVGRESSFMKPLVMAWKRISIGRRRPRSRALSAKR